MRVTRTAILAGAAALFVAGAAEAATARLHRMNVALPEGGVVQVQYSGDVAPTVTLEPVDARTLAVDPLMAPFAELERISALMEQQQTAMLQQMAQLAKAAQTGAARGLTLAGTMPAGSYSYTVVSTTGGNGCTQTVEWRSDGSSQQPRVTRTSAGNCDAVQRGTAIVPASSQQAPQAAAAPGKRV
ncbi:MAG: hypothetical protein JF593_04995 [Novosphingobium sp.]|nr:hypothetical protein [Novosphingobium sp.]